MVVPLVLGWVPDVDAWVLVAVLSIRNSMVGGRRAAIRTWTFTTTSKTFFSRPLTTGIALSLRL